MPPPYISNLDEYVYWLRDEIENSGGQLASERHLRVIYLEDDAGDVVGVQIPRDSLVFSETELKFRITIEESMRDEEYNFHFQRKDGTLLFRKDRQAGHPECGSLEHIHRHADDPDRAEPFQRVDLAEVLGEIHRYHESGETP